MKTQGRFRSNSAIIFKEETRSGCITQRRRGLSPKLQQNWEGPYTIASRNRNRCHLQIRGHLTPLRQKVIHINRLTLPSLITVGNGDCRPPSLEEGAVLQISKVTSRSNAGLAVGRGFYKVKHRVTSDSGTRDLQTNLADWLLATWRQPWRPGDNRLPFENAILSRYWLRAEICGFHEIYVTSLTHRGEYIRTRLDDIVCVWIDW
ncbi:hypothetical protein AVEN_267948-1 [Araneus ventricosus]|uniref:Uncharacterized protein n=1 Tax=Araneus ventricosus TaxID=182803 RepID=A0A4Y2J1B4_ARAVE|nr:hypothetical protein AVEN_267948-1 [Araneus ventricosus]